MLVLFLRTSKYIFPYFFLLNNECVNECAQRSFSARDFPSAVDGWLSSHIAFATALHSTLPFGNVPFHLTTYPSTRQLALPFDNSPFRPTTRPSVRRLTWCRSSARGCFGLRGRAWGRTIDSPFRSTVSSFGLMPRPPNLPQDQGLARVVYQTLLSRRFCSKHNRQRGNRDNVQRNTLKVFSVSACTFH